MSMVLAAVGSGLGTSPAQPINVGTGVTIDGNSGIITATNFVGGVEITSGTIVATAATFSGNVSVAGTLTYEDVTNIDSIGLITARSGLQVLAGITTLNGQVSAGNLNVTGVVTATSFTGDGSALTGVESWNQFDTWLYGGG